MCVIKQWAIYDLNPDDWSTKKYVPSKTKGVNVKVFHIKRINKVKTLAKHISCDCKCKYGSTTCNLNQKRNNDKCQFVCKKYNTSIVVILAHAFVRIVGI